ncbi:xanthine dehydrogenase small subunit [Andreprevotia chitinilytica]|uniref:xanthine dehydrogenase small subunit n=1 Tax=Andreprevotia chitinilytica TaxID=396808 RepID=UPI000552658E|nr:xanthine dehydrogenase small subunit [Andreprevotia chitinilytica]
MTARPIQFYFRGRVQQVDAVAPTRTVLQYLREDLHQTGSKEGCAEGDCGACTVVIGELTDDGFTLRAVNACIQFLPTLDGKALFTVEDLADGNTLHPVQQAMVDCHGSQCGFCTPGFVMSMWAMYEDRPTCPARDEVADVLSGNLCRCTGYRPILDAAKAAYTAPRIALDRLPVIAALRELAALSALEYHHENTRFFAPRSIDELAALRLAHPQATILAGSTDIGLWVTKQLRTLGDVIYLGAVDELRQVEHADGYLEIGAAVSLSDAFDALIAAEPAWQEIVRRFASLPIRNAGTLGGNVANGSPIGDSMPALIALGSRVVLRRGERVRDMPLEDFYLGYQKNALEAGEFVAALRVPDAVNGRLFRSYKISKRFDQDISAVCAAFAVTLDAANKVVDARIAYGGMAATPKRATACEAALRGQPWNEAGIAAAMAAIPTDFSPLTDMRASREYRLQVAASLLQRFWLETSAQSVPCRLDDLVAAGGAA